MKCTVTATIRRKGQEVEIEAEAVVDGYIAAIQTVKNTVDGSRRALDDNEFEGVRCLILDKIYPKQGYDVKAKRLLANARKYPQFP